MAIPTPTGQESIILITPTVFQELVFLAEESDAAADREQAVRALRALSSRE